MIKVQNDNNGHLYFTCCVYGQNIYQFVISPGDSLGRCMLITAKENKNYGTNIS